MSSKKFQLVLAIALAFIMMMPAVGAYADVARQTDDSAKTEEAVEDAEVVEEAVEDAEAVEAVEEAAEGAEQEAAPKQSGAEAVPSGIVCVDGLVIDWQEKPIEDGWIVTATPAGATGGQSPVAEPSEDDHKVGRFEFTDDQLGGIASWNFTIDYSGLPGNWSPVTPDSLDVEFETGAHKCARIRFKLRETVDVSVTKIDADHNPLPGWTIIATPGKENIFAEEWEGETDDNGVVLFEGKLTPGAWIFSERPPDEDDYEVEWDKFRPVVPVTGEQELNIISAYDDDYVEYYELRFKNKLHTDGCIAVTKTDDTPFGLAGWEISVLEANGTEVAYGYTDPTGKIEFEHLPAGPYTVVEETRSGWVSADVSMYDVDVKANEDCAVVNFVNTQKEDAFCIEGMVLDANGHYGLADWVVEATPVDMYGYELITETVTTTAPYGMYSIPFIDENGEAVDDYRLPKSTYMVCVKDDNEGGEGNDGVNGWVPHTKECYKVTLPEKPSKMCVYVDDFIYQQIGHSESDAYKGEMSKGGMEMQQCGQYHTAQQGEGLYAIGAIYDVPAKVMVSVNPEIAERPNMTVKLGEKVCIPGPSPEGKTMEMPMDGPPMGEAPMGPPMGEGPSGAPMMEMPMGEGPSGPPMMEMPMGEGPSGPPEGGPMAPEGGPTPPEGGPTPPEGGPTAPGQ